MRRTPAACSRATDASHSFLEKINQMAGSMAWWRSSSTAASMGGTRCPRGTRCQASPSSSPPSSSSRVRVLSAFKLSQRPHRCSPSAAAAASSRSEGGIRRGLSARPRASSSGSSAAVLSPGDRQNCHLSGTGRKEVVTVSHSPCTLAIHPLRSVGLRTVADIARMRMSFGRLMMHSSHTLPRPGSPR